MVGVLKGVTKNGAARTALCYVVDSTIAGDAAICLLGLRTLVDWGINLQHHMLEALQGHCSAVQLLQGGMTANALILNHLHGHRQSILAQEIVQRIFLPGKVREENPTLTRWLNHLAEDKAVATAMADPVLAFISDRATAVDLQHYGRQDGVPVAPCTCPIRYASTISADLYKELVDDATITADAGSASSESVLMSEIQIRNIVDRLDNETAEQGTNGDETMVKDGQTISKFSRLAMKIGPNVCEEIRNSLSSTCSKPMQETTRCSPPKTGHQKF